MSTPSAADIIRNHLQTFSVLSYIYQSQVASSLHLNPTDLLAIHHLDQKGELTAGQLGSYLGLSSGATTAAIDRLSKTGFITRRTHPNDRRRVYVSLNKNKLQSLKSQYDNINQHLDWILTQYPPDEQLTIARFLSALCFSANTEKTNG